MTDRESITQLEIMATNLTGEIGTAHSEYASKLLDAIDTAQKALKEREKRQKGCDGCRWKGRHQKCSCCARNRNLKDCFEQED